MEKQTQNPEITSDSLDQSSEVLGLIEQVKETISGYTSLFKLKIQKLLDTVFDWSKSLAAFNIELIEFGNQVRTVVAYKNGIDYPQVNNFLTKVFQREQVS